MFKQRTRPATYADIEALPAHVVGQIVYGILHAHPRPAPRHGVAAMRLGAQIEPGYGQGTGAPGGWIFMVEPELRLGSHIVVADIAGWRRDRLIPFPDTAYIETPPDWIAEILSPSTQALDRTDKLAIYAEYGVGHCWYVDPNAETLEVFALTGEKWLLATAFKNDDPVTAPPFATHTFALGVLWVRDLPPSPETAG